MEKTRHLRIVQLGRHAHDISTCETKMDGVMESLLFKQWIIKCQPFWRDHFVDANVAGSF